MVENNLIHESSPYLLQHANNPVNWYGWNDESLKKAKDENKPIFLSIGYSSCHWCHVMAHESFENEDVAEFMNEHFINIKVDREERPDIDDIYQKVCQIATGQGGWPLSIFLTPDQNHSMLVLIFLFWIRMAVLDLEAYVDNSHKRGQKNQKILKNLLRNLLAHYKKLKQYKLLQNWKELFLMRQL